MGLNYDLGNWFERRAAPSTIKDANLKHDNSNLIFPSLIGKMLQEQAVNKYVAATNLPQKYESGCIIEESNIIPGSSSFPIKNKP